MDIKLKKCPSCEGNIKLMANPFHIGGKCDCFARCTKCKKEYDLPKTKLKILKNMRVSKTTMREASMEWNNLELLQEVD